MKLSFTKKFIRDYHKLPSHIQEQTDRQLGLLLENSQHPSLNTKKMHDPRNIWEARVNFSYRLTFQIGDDCYILRRVGTHDILEKP